MHREINGKNHEIIKTYLDRYGVKFGIYKDNTFDERIFPFDMIPRVIEEEEYKILEKGLIQRVKALNAFLNDIYSTQQIVKDGIIPEEFITSSSGYFPQLCGVKPVKGIYAHISGIDLVQGKDSKWYVLEDNIRVPSGASYSVVARNITRMAAPEIFKDIPIRENRHYPQMLKEMMDSVNTGGINVILTPGRSNAAFFEHAFLAEKSGAKLVFPSELEVDGEGVYFRHFSGEKIRVGAIYRRISDEFLDPLAFNPHSLLGVPNLMSAYHKGEVAIVNAVGNGVADDKGIYYFVPKMVEYYLGEEPILENAPTYLPYFEKDMQYTLENIDKLVIKDVAEAGGYGVLFGRDLSLEKRDALIESIKKEPRRFISQEIIDFKELEIISDTKTSRKADFRAYVVMGAEEIHVWPSGLTRYTTRTDTFIVNSSQGGGFKDTWIIDSQK